MTKVSIAMATYNGEKFIEEQLLSIYTQTRQPDEVIVSDDCSTDNTLQIVENFIRKYGLDNWNIYINSNQPDNLPAKNRSTQNFINALRKSSGDLIFLCDQDDVWNADKIEIMVSLMEENDKILALSSNYSIIDQSGRELLAAVPRPQAAASLSVVNLESFCKCRSYNGMGMVVRKCAVEYLLSLNLPDLIAHDWGLNIISCAFDGMYFYNKVLSQYRQHDNNIYGWLPYKERKNQRDFISRVKKLENDSFHYRQALQIINQLESHRIVDPRKKTFLISLIKFIQKRINYTENKSVIFQIFSFDTIRYFTVKTYVGDIIYSLKLEKYFK